MENETRTYDFILYLRSSSHGLTARFQSEWTLDQLELTATQVLNSAQRRNERDGSSVISSQQLVPGGNLTNSFAVNADDISIVIFNQVEEPTVNVEGMQA